MWASGESGGAGGDGGVEDEQQLRGCLAAASGLGARPCPLACSTGMCLATTLSFAVPVCAIRATVLIIVLIIDRTMSKLALPVSLAGAASTAALATCGGGSRVGTLSYNEPFPWASDPAWGAAGRANAAGRRGVMGRGLC